MGRTGPWGQYKTPGMLGSIHAQRGRLRSALSSRVVIRFVYLTLQDLPLELCLMIFKMLPPIDLANCRLICHGWNDLIQNKNMLMKKIWSIITVKTRIEEAKNGNIEFVRALIEFATNPNQANQKGWTPLHESAYQGHLEVCRLMLEKIEDTNPPDEEGETPLHCAARSGHLEVCRLILETDR